MPQDDSNYTGRALPPTAEMQHHPITPPPELYKQWEGMPRSLAFEAAYRAGADQELEACCDWFVCDWNDIETVDMLRAARRPEPPSLNEVALQMLSTIERDAHYLPEITDTIRCALEQLND